MREREGNQIREKESKWGRGRKGERERKRDGLPTRSCAVWLSRPVVASSTKRMEGLLTSSMPTLHTHTHTHPATKKRCEYRLCRYCLVTHLTRFRCPPLIPLCSESPIMTSAQRLIPSISISDSTRRRRSSAVVFSLSSAGVG